MNSLRTVRLGSGWSAAVALCLICAPAARVCAAERPPGPPHGTSVQGAAWAADNSPVARARLQLRNVVSGRIEAATIADDKGRFGFSGIEGGSYVVELVNDAGKILVVGNPFVIAPGETVSTFVRLGAKVPWFTGFFGNAAAAAATSAASQGITALAPVQIPISRKQ